MHTCLSTYFLLYALSLVSMRAATPSPTIYFLKVSNQHLSQLICISKNSVFFVDTTIQYLLFFSSSISHYLTVVPSLSFFVQILSRHFNFSVFTLFKNLFSFALYSSLQQTIYLIDLYPIYQTYPPVFVFFNFFLVLTNRALEDLVNAGTHASPNVRTQHNFICCPTDLPLCLFRPSTCSLQVCFARHNLFVPIIPSYMHTCIISP